MNEEEKDRIAREYFAERYGREIAEGQAVYARKDLDRDDALALTKILKEKIGQAYLAAYFSPSTRGTDPPHRW